MKFLLKLLNLKPFFHALAQIMLMKHEPCFESRNHAVRKFLVP